MGNVRHQLLALALTLALPGLALALPGIALASEAVPLAEKEVLNGKEVLGVWWTPKQESKMEFFEKNGKVYGRIVWMPPAAEHLQDPHNPDPAKRSGRRLGMVIFSDFRFDGDDEWVGGTIYNPEDGRTYSGKMTLEAKDRLRVRGFIGIPLLGGTAVFTRP